MFVVCSVANAENKEKIGVLYSYQNVMAYEENAEESFDIVWQNFTNTFEKSYLNTQYLTNITPETKVEDLGVNIILFPLAIDIDQIEVNFLSSFIKSGGKLIVFSGLGMPSERLKIFLQVHGITLNNIVVSGKDLTLRTKENGAALHLPSGSYYSLFECNKFGYKVFGRWNENNGLGIGGIENLVYGGYSIGQNSDIDSEVNLVYDILNYFSPGSLENLELEITKKEFEDILETVLSLKETADLVVGAIGELDLSISSYELRKHFKQGLSHVESFNSNFLFGSNIKARKEANLARSEFALVTSLGMPVRKAEIRAIWLDRGTIVNCGGPKKLEKIIKDLADSGFNVIFFETINAGYSIYPSAYLEKNPLIKGWDPLQVAIESAHKNNIKLHAWVWTFAVGNSRHNLLIGEREKFSGPVISKKGRKWALSSENGKLRIHKQPEVWLSPANKKACEFLTQAFSEIVSKYNVDGIHLDYIRFPFQKNDEKAGFDFISKLTYKKDTGKLIKVEDPNKAWVTWKTQKVNEFVKNISFTLKLLKPNLNLSVAVFAIPRDRRMDIIQQDWETWLTNKWVDVAYPFYYSYLPDEIKIRFDDEINSTDNKALIVPAFNLSLLNEGELAERIIAARDAGALGIAFFATAHLDQKINELLTKGLYREKANVIPYDSPVNASRELFNELVALVRIYNDENNSNVLSDKSTKENVFRLISELEVLFADTNTNNIGALVDKLDELQIEINNLFSLEKYLNRGQRMVYLDSYLKQIKTLLNYFKSKQQSSQT